MAGVQQTAQLAAKHKSIIALQKILVRVQEEAGAAQNQQAGALTHPAKNAQQRSHGTVMIKPLAKVQEQAGAEIIAPLTLALYVQNPSRGTAILNQTASQTAACGVRLGAKIVLTHAHQQRATIQKRIKKIS